MFDLSPQAASNAVANYSAILYTLDQEELTRFRADYVEELGIATYRKALELTKKHCEINIVQSL